LGSTPTSTPPNTKTTQARTEITHQPPNWTLARAGFIFCTYKACAWEVTPSISVRPPYSSSRQGQWRSAYGSQGCIYCHHPANKAVKQQCPN